MLPSPSLLLRSPKMTSLTLLALFILLLGPLFSLIHLLSTASSWRKHRNNARKLPPGPQPLPIIGNLHMLGALPHRALRRLAQIHGPIMFIRLGHVPTIVVSSPQTAELFLKTHDSIFASRPKVQSSEYLSHGAKGIAFTPYGPYWRNVRKLCTLQLLSVSKIESFAGLRREEMAALVASLKKAAAAREVVDVSAKVGEVVKDMMCKMIFGRSNCEEDGYNLRELVEEATNLAGAFNLADYLPFLGALDLQGFTRRLKVVSRAIDKVMDKIVYEHQNKDSSKQVNHSNFVDVLLSLMNQPINPKDKQVYTIDRTNIKAILLDMISGSFDTSTTEIEWAFSELLRHPQVMMRLQNELESVVGRNQMVEEKDLNKLEYLNMIVKETLRLHPAAPLLVPHEAIEDVEINGYFIPKKSRIVINCWAIGRDSNSWSNNAEEFYPERFNASNINLLGRDFQLIPFGSGRRGCPGIQLGLTTIRLVLAQLVHCFNWEISHGVLPAELDMSEKFGLSMPRAKHLLAKPTYRLLANE